MKEFLEQNGYKSWDSKDEWIGKYPQETFSKFFEELKSYGTKYCDSMNHSLYYTSDVGYKVVEAFPEIFKKYKDMCQQEYERNRVKELEAELAKLKGE